MKRYFHLILPKRTNLPLNRYNKLKYESRNSLDHPSSFKTSSPHQNKLGWVFGGIVGTSLLWTTVAFAEEHEVEYDNDSEDEVDEDYFDPLSGLGIEINQIPEREVELSEEVEIEEPLPFSKQDINDVNWWLQYYYQHPNSDYFIRALKILVEEGELVFDEKRQTLSGMLITTLKQHPQEAVQWIKELEELCKLDVEKRVLWVALWASGIKQGQSYLKSLVPSIREQDTALFVEKLTETIPFNVVAHVQSDLDFANVKVKMMMLSGLYYASGDVELIKGLFDIAKEWRKETVTEEGGFLRYYVAMVARNHLLSLCIAHPPIREMCLSELKKGQHSDDVQLLLHDIATQLEQLSL